MPSSFRVPPDIVTVRHKRGISLSDIATSTKINVNYLKAIEDGDFEKLPGGTYNTSYLRQYARAIEYDEDELLEFYHRATRPKEEPSEPAAAGWQSGLLMWLVRLAGLGKAPPPVRLAEQWLRRDR
jgi:transcriptional regulator with XRE-family HTH domain